MPPNDKEKIDPNNLAFNNKAVEAIAANAKIREETRKKNQDVAAQYAARRRANRKAAGSTLTKGSKIQGLANLNNTLGRQFIGPDAYDV